MKTLQTDLVIAGYNVLIGALAGCATASTKSADVSSQIRTALDQAGFSKVSVESGGS